MAFLEAMALGAIVSVKAGNSFQVLQRLGQFFDENKKKADEWKKVLGATAAGLGALAATTAPAALAVKQMSDEARSFEAQMATVAAVMLTSRSEIQDMEATAKRLGGTTVFTSTQVAEGMELMARAGFSVADIIGPGGKGGGIEGILAAAAAEGIELADAANYISNVLKGMQLPTSQASRVADVLALAASRTNSSIASLGESMKNVSGTAHLFGISLEDTIASVALLQDVGLDASVAGSAMNTMLNKMAKFTKPVQEQLEQLGVTFRDEATGNMLPLMDVLANIEKAASTAGGNLDAAGLMVDMFGLRGQKAAVQLQELVRTGAFGKLRAELMGATDVGGGEGAAEKMARLRLDSLDGALTLMKSALSNFAIEAFLPINTEIRGLVDLFKKFVQGVIEGMNGAGDTFANSFGQGVKMAIDMVTWLIHGFRVFVEGLMPEGSSMVGKFIGFLATAVFFMAAFIAPIAAAGAAIAGLAYMAAPFIGTLGAIVKVILVVAAVLFAMMSDSERGGTLLSGIWNGMLIIYERMSFWLGIMWKAIQGPLTQAAKSLESAFSNFFSAFTDNMGASDSQITNFANGLGAVVAFVGTLIAVFIELGAIVIGVAAKMFNAFMDGFVWPFWTGIKMVWEGIVDIFSDREGGLMKAMLGLGLILISPFTGLINVVLDIFDQIFQEGEWLFKKFGIDVQQGRDFIAGVRGVTSLATGQRGLIDNDAVGLALSKSIGQMGADQQADVANPPNPENVVNVEANPCVTVSTKLEVDRRELAKATSRQDQELSERSGLKRTPWQRRKVAESGAVAVAP